MAAPTTAARVKKTLANPEPSTHGPSRQNDRPLFVQICASLVPRNIKAELEQKPQVAYHISDHPMTNEEWEDKWCKGNAPGFEN